MLRSVLDARDNILELAENGPIRIAVIDPGTNCAIRHSEVTLTVPNSNGRAGFNTRPLGQRFYAGGTAGKNYVERMAGLAAFLEGDQLFWQAHFYLVESQFEMNVAITVGVLIGIISSRRGARPENFRRKRTGTLAAELPYEILGVPPQLKSHSIHAICGQRPAQKDIKELSIRAATEICRNIGDAEGASYLNGKKADDAADTVCMEHAIYSFLADAEFFNSATKKPRASATKQKNASATNTASA